MLPENIVEGKEIFGKTGTAKAANFKITSGYYLCYNRQEIAQQLTNMCGAITNAYGMFYNCSDITELDLSKLDTSQCTNMSNMFYGCKSLVEIKGISDFDTSNVTNMSDMFNNCRELRQLDVSKWNTSKVTNMSNMFNGLVKLTELDLSKLNTSNVTNMGQMLRDVYVSEIDVSNFNTSNVTDMNYMMAGMIKITELDLSNWDMSKVTSVGSIFWRTSKLETIKSFKNLGKAYTYKGTNNYSYTLNLNEAENLTHDSIVDIITNGLYDLNLTYDVANGGTLYTQTLKLGSTNIAKLEATEEGRQALALAAAKRLDSFVERRKNLWN